MSIRACWPAVVLLSLFVLGSAGCAVPQPPGHGFCERLVEPETDTGYWLYLPEDYVKNSGRHPNHQRWPVVVTFHGLKPYDNANPQVRSWQQEADRYGFIVIAPELQTCDSLTMQFPLRDPELPYVRGDEKAVLSIMDEVFRRTNADPSRVLSTSFSSGGYMAHFMVNRHPERFACLVVMGSNFNDELLDTAQIPKYRNMRVAVFFGENDFAVCREESMRAVEWYRKYRFYVEAKKVAGLGHERRPQTAAAFFASAIGVTPKTPPDLNSLVMQEIMPVPEVRPVPRREPEPRSISPAPEPGSRGPVTQSPPQSTARQDALFSTTPAPPPAGKPTEPTRVAPARPPTRTPAPVRNSPPGEAKPTPKRPLAQPYSRGPSAGNPAAPPGGEGDLRPEAAPGSVPEPAGDAGAVPVASPRIRILGRRVAPMWIHLGLDLLPDLRPGASVLWIDNGKPIGTGHFDTQSILWTPGLHTIEAHVTLADGRKLAFRDTVSVAAPAPASQAAAD